MTILYHIEFVIGVSGQYSTWPEFAGICFDRTAEPWKESTQACRTLRARRCVQEGLLYNSQEFSNTPCAPGNKSPALKHVECLDCLYLQRHKFAEHHFPASKIPRYGLLLARAKLRLGTAKTFVPAFWPAPSHITKITNRSITSDMPARIERAPLISPHVSTNPNAALLV
jgi:hypothetical protein